MHLTKKFQHDVITGIVVQGKQLGRTIGFPTANMVPNKSFDSSLPKGVYGVYIFYKEEQYIGVMNVGERPSFDDGNHLTHEVHILDFSANLYGEELTVEIVFFIRNEKNFFSLLDLVQQFNEDMRYTTNRLQKGVYLVGGNLHA